MTDKEILEKAIQKAIDGGWNQDKAKNFQYKVLDNLDVDWDPKALFTYVPAPPKPYQAIIFNHDFTKTIWDENEMKDCKFPDCDDTCLSMWQFHLQQMVISPNPIQYLGDNL